MVKANCLAAEPAIDPSQRTAKRVESLDVLRLVAVLGVVLFHYGFRGPASHQSTLVAIPGIAAIARYGYLGVPVFFIISGFVIAYSAQGRTARDFVIARIVRIYPTFLLCMTITFAATLALGSPSFESSARRFLANLFIASPALGQPYMDSAYWSLVAEVTFYAWVALLMMARVFPRRIDSIVVIWLGMSMLNELTIDALIFEKIFLADYSGFFSAGLLIYELHLGRRDTKLQILLASAVGVSVFQAVHNLAWLRDQTGFAFDDWVVAAICLSSIWTIIACTQVRRFPIPSGTALAIGGLTYPLYLLHQKLGYVILFAVDPIPHSTFFTAAIVLGIVVVSWLLWRLFERPTQKWLKRSLKAWASGPERSTTEPAAGPSIERGDEIAKRALLANR